MLDRKLLESLGGWQGYIVERVEWPEGAGRSLQGVAGVASKLLSIDIHPLPLVQDTRLKPNALSTLHLSLIAQMSPG